jgi:hypothetical protein
MDDPALDVTRWAGQPTNALRKRSRPEPTPAPIPNALRSPRR